jgi:hypothetical protein
LLFLSVHFGAGKSAAMVNSPSIASSPETQVKRVGLLSPENQVKTVGLLSPENQVRTVGLLADTEKRDAVT